MDELHLHYDVAGDNFLAAGEASSDMKRVLKQLGFDAQTARRAAICMYEGEINMVIHADGGDADVYIDESAIKIVLADRGPGIEDIGQAMQAGFSTASQEVRDLGFGAGMGLPNIKQYSDKLEVNSQIGIGTTVAIVVKP